MDVPINGVGGGGAGGDMITMMISLSKAKEESAATNKIVKAQEDMAQTLNKMGNDPDKGTTVDVYA